MNGHGVLFRNGILFTGGSPKGPAVATLLQLLKLRPKKIVFINDKKTHLEDVAGTIEKLQIPFVGLRYSFSDKRVASFNPDLAEIQFHHSPVSRLLSDAEAELLLKGTP